MLESFLYVLGLGSFTICVVTWFLVTGWAAATYLKSMDIQKRNAKAWRKYLGLDKEENKNAN